MTQPVVRRVLTLLVPPPPAVQVKVPQEQPGQPSPPEAADLIEMPSSVAVASLGHAWPRMLGISRY